MRLTIRLDPNRLRQWHLRLVQRLAQRPLTRVAVEWGGGAAPLPHAATVVAAIECLLYRLPGRSPFAVASPADFALFVPRDGGGPDDVVFDLCGGDPRPGERTWHLYFDGRRAEAAAIGALIRSRTPVVSIVDASTGSEIVSGHPGVQNSRVLARAFDDVMARTATLVKAALDGATPRFRGERPVCARAGTAAIAWFWLKSMLFQALTLFYRLFYNTPHWRIGYRFVRGRDVVDLRAHPVGGWSVLADNGLRFYSDPFPVEKDGRTFLFLEDLEHRLNRGVISVVEFDAGGPIGTPRPVLDTGSHLSYPFVFEHGGEMWMVPESCSTASVDLYRAERFPDGWVKQATLVSGVVASDATLFEHDGRWWMFATVQDGGGSYSDALHVWSAPAIAWALDAAPAQSRSRRFGDGAARRPRRAARPKIDSPISGLPQGLRHSAGPRGNHSPRRRSLRTARRDHPAARAAVVRAPAAHPQSRRAARMHRWFGIAEKALASLRRPATAPAHQAFADDGVT